MPLKTFWQRNKSVQRFSPHSIHFIDLFYHACDSTRSLQCEINIPRIISLQLFNKLSFGI